MWDINYYLKDLIPVEKKGYEYIKKINLFIPYIEMGLNVLIRKEQQLPLFTEVILQLIYSKCNSVARISEVTGVEEEIVNNVVGEMAASDLIYIRSGDLVLTPSGESALKNLQEVRIEKEELNRVYINAITGHLVELETMVKKLDSSDTCLDEQIRVTDEYIAEHFQQFNDFYQKRQEDLDLGDIGLKELYQILNKTYENLCYQAIVINVYINSKDNDLIFESEEKRDSIYASLLGNQIHKSVNARNFLVNRFIGEKYLGGGSNPIDPDMERNKKALITFVQNQENNVKSAEFDRVYFTDRYLLDGEYRKILSLLGNIRPPELIISADFLTDLFDDSMISLLHTIINNHDTNVTILCEKNDRARTYIKNKMFKIDQKKQKNITWVEVDNLKKKSIIIGTSCAITVNSTPLKIGNQYLIKEESKITFEKNRIEDINKEIIELISLVSSH